MADRRTRSEYIKEIAESLIANEESLSHLRDADIRIGYLESEWGKKTAHKHIMGECEKIPERYKWAIPYDFTVTVFNPNVGLLNKNQLRALVFHELLHIGVTDDAKGQFYIVPHDVEDFYTILDRYGLRWNIPEDLPENPVG